MVNIFQIFNILGLISEYEIASRAVLDAMDSALCVDGISSKEVRKLDYQLQGNENL